MQGSRAEGHAPQGMQVGDKRLPLAYLVATAMIFRYGRQGGITLRLPHRVCFEFTGS